MRQTSSLLEQVLNKKLFACYSEFTSAVIFNSAAASVDRVRSAVIVS